ncbi:unnamed protein product, partial [Adineta steineri]
VGVLVTLVSIISSLTVVLRIGINLLVKFAINLFKRTPQRQNEVKPKLKDRLKKMFLTIIMQASAGMMDLNIFPLWRFGSNTDRMTAKRLGQWSTRLYIVLFITSLTTIIIYIGVQPQMLTKSFNEPSLNIYNRLLLDHGDTLQCPCSSISSTYSQFIQIKPVLHQQTINNRKNTTQQSDHEETTGRIKGEQNLEINHSQYLLMDDGTVRKYDTENFRTRLIKQISQTESEGVLPIPCVTIVVEGGKDTIKNVYYDLKENIPVVIIDGSGRVADFLKRWLLYTEEEMNNNARHPDWVKPVGIDEFNDIEEPPTAILHQSRDSLNGNAFEKPELQSLFEKYQNRINEELEAMLTRDDADTVKSKQKEAPEHGINEKNETETLKYVLYCLQPAVRSQIIVFDLNSDNDLSEAIFRSICKVYHKPQSKQSKQLLELAMSWKSIDIAKELILQNSLENIHGKNELFIKALTKDLPNFVHEFIRMGVDPSEVFFPNDQCFSTNLKPNEYHSRYDFFIQKLYSTEAVNRPECLLVSVIESDPDVLDKCIDGTNILNSIIGKLIGDHMEHLYFDTYDDELEYRKLRDHTMYSDKSSQIEDGRSEQSSKSASREMAQDYIMRDLFLWAILMNYIDMAKVFLAHMKYRICAALIA